MITLTKPNAFLNLNAMTIRKGRNDLGKRKSRWNRFFGRHESVFTGFLYSLELPMGIVAGFKFAANDYIIGAILIGFTMIIEVACAHKWIGTQTRQITKALVEQP